MSQRRFDIGDHCTFRDKGCTREGRVVGIEDVGRGDLRGRSAGRWVTLAIRGELFASVEVPESALGSILDAVG